MSINPDTMTPDQLRDALARAMGWVPLGTGWKRTLNGSMILSATCPMPELDSPLAPGVLAELRKKNPIDAETGRRANKHFQHLTVDRGHPKLKEHLAAVTALMRASTSKEGFLKLLDKAFPKFKPAPLFTADDPHAQLPPPPQTPLGEAS